MPSVIFIDGARTPPERAAVSVFDRGFLYGDTIFETLRVYEGIPHLLVAHLERLRCSAALVGIDLPSSADELAAEVRSAVAASAERDAVVRITVSRGSGPLGIDPRKATHPCRIVLVEPLSARLGAATPGPIAVRIVASRRGADLAVAAKIGCYVDSILALRVAQAAGDDDAVLVDASGLVLEATTSNLFVVTRAGLLVTPPEQGIFAGLTRREVLRIAAEGGLSPSEAPLTRHDLRAAREVLLTSSVREIVPVGRIDGDDVGDGAMGPTTAALVAAYRAGLPGAR